ncbi:MAG: hypothetical protein H6684_00985 [Deltaproteobacteria bacterium]|nr:hypothetical protein [Deltaproteobacteria bacterium]
MPIKTDSKTLRLLVTAPILALALAIAVAGCGKKGGDPAVSLIEQRVTDFYHQFQITQDPLAKAAAFDEKADPRRAAEYLEAHEKLRSMMADPKRKTDVLAAFLLKKPSSVRILEVDKSETEATVLVALGPTDEKLGRFLLVVNGEDWLIKSFEDAPPTGAS